MTPPGAPGKSTRNFETFSFVHQKCSCANANVPIDQIPISSFFCLMQNYLSYAHTRNFITTMRANNIQKILNSKQYSNMLHLPLYICNSREEIDWDTIYFGPIKLEREFQQKGEQAIQSEFIKVLLKHCSYSG